MDDHELACHIVGYERHLRTVCEIFNSAAAEAELAVRMSPDKAIAAIDVNLGEIAPFWSRIDDSGIVHEAQLKTAVACLSKLINSSERCGHVLGAMQSGKTTTSLTLQWAGPVLYMLRGERLYPFYIISNQTNHEDQTKAELDRFSAYYGNLEFRMSDGSMPGGIDAMFARSSTLSTYRKYVLRDAMEYVQPVAPLDDLVHRRVQGHQGVEQIVDLCRRASAQDYQPLMIIDEPQFGASDRIVASPGGPTRRPCLLQQIFEQIEEVVGVDRNDHRFIGLSATPFELNDLSRVWEVRQCLAEGYSGFNVFNGEDIDSEVDVVPPETLGLTEFSERIGEPFVADISMAAYDGSSSVFSRHAARIEYSGDQEDYQLDTIAALRAAIDATLRSYADSSRPVGFCIRAFNDNARTEALISRLALDEGRVEIIRYFGVRATGVSIKKIIGRRQRLDLPYIIFVTNRARMADAFPADVRFFVDLVQRAQDLNALLQGLLGRACGYGKASTVILSDFNSSIVQAYSATHGGYVMKTSRHSITVGGGLRRGAPTGMIKLRDDMPDALVQEFFAEINAHVVAPNLPPGDRMSPSRARRSAGGSRFRTAPILRIAERVGLFGHVEDASVRSILFPQIRAPFDVVRPGDVVQHTRRRATRLSYQLDDAGDCRFTFRWSDRNSGAQGGAAGRAKGSRDAGQHLEPTVYVEKFDPASGEVINKKDIRAGAWRAFMVTFPLRKPVQEFEVATVAYPTETSAFDHLVTDEERALRSEEMAARRRGKGAAPENLEPAEAS